MANTGTTAPVRVTVPGHASPDRADGSRSPVTPHVYGGAHLYGREKQRRDPKPSRRTHRRRFAGRVPCAPENMDARGLPSKFYGFTESGVRVLDQYNYLNGLPVARALYELTKKTEQVERHEGAPRPSLPGVVQNALVFEKPEKNGDRESYSECRFSY